MKCVWDPKKNEINQRRHGLSFKLAELVFDGPYAITTDDYIDEQSDQRYQTIAMYEGALFLIAHLYVEIEGVEMPRILSFRKANDYEQEKYFRLR